MDPLASSAFTPTYRSFGASVGHATAPIIAVLLLLPQQSRSVLLVLMVAPSARHLNQTDVIRNVAAFLAPGTSFHRIAVPAPKIRRVRSRERPTWARALTKSLFTAERNSRRAARHPRRHRPASLPTTRVATRLQRRLCRRSYRALASSRSKVKSSGKRPRKALLQLECLHDGCRQSDG